MRSGRVAVAAQKFTDVAVAQTLRISMTRDADLVILGGGNLIATYLLRRLAAQDLGALVMARRPVEVPPGCGFLLLDALNAGDWAAPEHATVVSILPLAALIRMLPHLSGAGSIIAIGSTSLFSKARSADPRDRQAARSLAEAEAALTAWCTDHGIHYTILRPTLVYDGSGDRNVARMARFVRRFHVLPVAKPASGLRQPIHADDIAKAILGAVGNPTAQDRAFNIAGAEILTYRAMAERVFAAEGRKPRFLELPVAWLEAIFRLGARCGLVRETGISSSVFQRMNEDLVFDTAEGLAVLDYRPRRFEPGRPPAQADRASGP